MSSYELNWEPTCYRLEGESCVGTLHKIQGVGGEWKGSVLMFSDDPGVLEPLNRFTAYGMEQEAIEDLEGKIGSEIEKFLIKEEAKGVGEFQATVESNSTNTEEGLLYSATCFPTYFTPPVILTNAHVSQIEARELVERAYEIYLKSMEAVLGAAGAVESAHKNRGLKAGALERVIQGAAEASFRLSASDEHDELKARIVRSLHP